MHGDARYFDPQLLISIFKVNRAAGESAYLVMCAIAAGTCIWNIPHSDGVRERRVLAHGPEDSRTMGDVKTRIDCARNGFGGEWSGVRIRIFAVSTLVRVVLKPPGRLPHFIHFIMAKPRPVRALRLCYGLCDFVPNIVTQPRPRASSTTRRCLFLRLSPLFPIPFVIFILPCRYYSFLGHSSNVSFTRCHTPRPLRIIYLPAFPSLISHNRRLVFFCQPILLIFYAYSSRHSITLSFSLHSQSSPMAFSIIIFSRSACLYPDPPAGLKLFTARESDEHRATYRSRAASCCTTCHNVPELPILSRPVLTAITAVTRKATFRPFLFTTFLSWRPLETPQEARSTRAGTISGKPRMDHV
ncbi:hypothetical protein B0H11DRAFT_2281717 [Mycena galericulata]|nr:hypothetical protein B0H11DRAFT_2281717 [Mycena galericulata]